MRVAGGNASSRAFYSKNNLHLDWHPLGVCRGKLYAIHLGVFLSVDIAAGTSRNWTVELSLFSGKTKESVTAVPPTGSMATRSKRPGASSVKQWPDPCTTASQRDVSPGRLG